MKQNPGLIGWYPSESGGVFLEHISINNLQQCVHCCGVAVIRRNWRCLGWQSAKSWRKARLFFTYNYLVLLAILNHLTQWFCNRICVQDPHFNFAFDVFDISANSLVARARFRLKKLKNIAIHIFLSYTHHVEHPIYKVLLRRGSDYK